MDEIDKILGTMPVNLSDGGDEPDFETIVHNAIMYNLAHDVLAWLSGSSTAMEMFKNDMKSSFNFHGKEAPNDETIEHNIQQLHMAFDHIVKVFEQRFGIKAERADDDDDH